METNALSRQVLQSWRGGMRVLLDGCAYVLKECPVAASTGFITFIHVLNAGESCLTCRDWCWLQ